MEVNGFCVLEDSDKSVGVRELFGGVVLWEVELVFVLEVNVDSVSEENISVVPIELVGLIVAFPVAVVFVEVLSIGIAVFEGFIVEVWGDVIIPVSVGKTVDAVFELVIVVNMPSDEVRDGMIFVESVVFEVIWVVLGWRLPVVLEELLYIVGELNEVDPDDGIILVPVWDVWELVVNSDTAE